jgi:hypothetical protein
MVNINSLNISYGGTNLRGFEFYAQHIYVISATADDMSSTATSMVIL